MGEEERIALAHILRMIQGDVQRLVNKVDAINTECRQTGRNPVGGLKRATENQRSNLAWFIHRGDHFWNPQRRDSLK